VTRSPGDSLPLATEGADLVVEKQEFQLMGVPAGADRGQVQKQAAKGVEDRDQHRRTLAPEAEIAADHRD
jgi:hypothetical protein